MKQESHIDLFEAYLHGRLSSSELNRFKDRLKSDTIFKKEYLQFLLSQASWSNEALDKDRELMQDVYRSMQQVGYQTPTKTYRLKRYISDHRAVLSVAASLLLLLIFSIVIYQSTAPSGEQLYAQLFVEPVGMERASVVERQFFEKASYFYFQDQPMLDSLEAQVNLKTSFNIPVYYLAHAYFKTRQYDKALELFELCLGNLDYINQVPQLQGSDLDLRFNTMLCKAILKKDKGALEREISSLEKSLEPTHPLQVKLKQLRKELD